MTTIRPVRSSSRMPATGQLTARAASLECSGGGRASARSSRSIAAASDGSSVAVGAACGPGTGVHVLAVAHEPALRHELIDQNAAVAAASSRRSVTSRRSVRAARARTSPSVAARPARSSWPGPARTRAAPASTTSVGQPGHAPIGQRAPRGGRGEPLQRRPCHPRSDRLGKPERRAPGSAAGARSRAAARCPERSRRSIRA